MGAINDEIGKNLRSFRRQRKLTLEAVAAQIGRSKSTISKYEKGEIMIDIETLYELAAVYRVHVEQLLFVPAAGARPAPTGAVPGFFSGLRQFYGYLFDGRDNSIIRCVFDVLDETEPGRFKIMLYMNDRGGDYRDCENTYYGFMDHYDAVTTLTLTNAETPMEKASCQVLAAYLDAETKWALWTGFSSRPMMPVAAKMLLSKRPLAADAALAGKLRISREDIRLLKLYNMFAVT